MNAEAEVKKEAPVEVAVEGSAQAGASRDGLRIALAGNPNCGKTTIFNALTGAHQKVGNYPGVTVERRDGRFELGDGRGVALVDLPGTYSLTSLSPEERVAQDELLSGENDVIVVVADSTNLNRNLVLLAQIMQMGANLVLCLNMADEARAAGQVLDLTQMEKLLGCPVVETVGHKRQGIDALKAAIDRALASPRASRRLVLGERLDNAIGQIRALIPADFGRPEIADWVATKLLMGDAETTSRFLAHKGSASAASEIAAVRARIESETGHDAPLLVTEGYFAFVDGLLREVMTQRSRADARALTEKIDAVLAHRVLGLPIFAAVMYAIFWITFTIGDPFMGWIEEGFGWLGGWVSGLWPEGSDSLLRSLLVDGVIGGVGGVVVFLPNILLLFACLAVLEDTGYMARAAFLVDQLMHRFGLHGKSFIPMMTGFGCTVPGIMATRTMENERDRLATMFVLPLVSCGARMPIWLLLIPAFFPQTWRAPMLFGVYAVGIVLALLVALLLRKTVLKGDDAPFVMELPPYRLPTLRGALTKVGERGWLYLKKAGTIILAVSIVLWALTTFPKAGSYEVDRLAAAGHVEIVADPEPSEGEGEGEGAAKEGEEAAHAAEPAGPSLAERLAMAQKGEKVTLLQSEADARNAEEDLNASLAGKIGHALEPVFKPLGFDWKMVTAMLGAFAAKEVFVAQMGIIYSLGEVDESSESLQATLRSDYSPLVGVSLMLFLLISAPCMATIAVTKRESNSWKWALGQLGGLTALAYIVSLVVFQVGRLLGF